MRVWKEVVKIKIEGNNKKINNRWINKQISNCKERRVLR